MWRTKLIAETGKDGIEKPNKCGNSESYQILLYCQVMERIVRFGALWNRARAAFHITFITTLKIEKLNLTVSLQLSENLDQSGARELFPKV